MSGDSGDAVILVNCVGKPFISCMLSSIGRLHNVAHTISPSFWLKWKWRRIRAAERLPTGPSDRHNNPEWMYIFLLPHSLSVNKRTGGNGLPEMRLRLMQANYCSAGANSIFRKSMLSLPKISSLFSVQLFKIAFNMQLFVRREASALAPARRQCKATMTPSTSASLMHWKVNPL